MTKILNVIGSLNIGGAEINTMNILRNLTPNKYHYEFIVFDESPGVFEAEAEQLGATIHRLIEPKKNYKLFFEKFNQLLKKNNYDVIHVNTLWNSGFLLRIAKRNNIPIRICHSHSTESSAHENFKYKVYKSIMQRLILNYATDYIGCGRDAGNYLYGEKIFQKQGQIIYNGINLDKFRFKQHIREAVRETLGISYNTFLIGHVGRMAPVKNHRYIIELAEKLQKMKKDFKILFVGDGPDFQEIKTLISNKNLEDYFLLLGNRKDVHELLQSMDVLLFPSFFEGFPVTLIEAQASSLPCLISTGVTKEAKLSEETHFISLSDNTIWKKKIIEYMNNPIDRKSTNLELIERKFDIVNITRQWEELYDTQ